MAKVYLTASALLELGELARVMNDKIGKSEVAFISETDLMLMDEGLYSLQDQNLKVSLEYSPDLFNKNADEYVVVIESDKKTAN